MAEVISAPLNTPSLTKRTFPCLSSTIIAELSFSSPQPFCATPSASTINCDQGNSFLLSSTLPRTKGQYQR